MKHLSDYLTFLVADDGRMLFLKPKDWVQPPPAWRELGGFTVQLSLGTTPETAKLIADAMNGKPEPEDWSRPKGVPT